MTMQRIDLDHLPEGERFDAWTVLTDPFFHVSREAEPSVPFRCRMATRQWGEALLIETEVSGQRYEHGAKHARAGGWDQIAFQMYRSGSFKGLYGADLVEAGAGDVNVIDFSRTYAKESTDQADLNLIVPREMVEQRLPAIWHGALLRSGEPLGRLAGIHLDGLMACADRLDATEAMRAIASFLMILSGSSLADADPQEIPFVRSTARQAAEAFLRRHLMRSDLEPAAVARHCGVSRASLYRLFQADGGVHAFMRRERLNRARGMIGEKPSMPLQTIGEACGFNDAASFSRMFRRAFDVSPSEYRAGATAAIPHALPRPAAWIETVRRFQTEG